MSKLTLDLLQKDLQKLAELNRIQSRNISALELRVQITELKITGIKKKLQDLDTDNIPGVNEDMTI